mmetsp:Transcript_72404/g.145686  ORF Transcript_72404/g.145686 Transcript_72404/m.145686 type:complete len:92 (-) Transcript_72404:287-562(-)
MRCSLRHICGNLTLQLCLLSVIRRQISTQISLLHGHLRWTTRNGGVQLGRTNGFHRILGTLKGQRRKYSSQSWMINALCYFLKGQLTCIAG